MDTQTKIVAIIKQVAGKPVDPSPEESLFESGMLDSFSLAGPHDSVASLGVQAAQDCLARAGMAAAEIGLILVSSGSAEHRFPGPAAPIGHVLGISGVPAIDLPIASAGSLFAMSLAARLS